MVYSNSGTVNVAAAVETLSLTVSPTIIPPGATTSLTQSGNLSTAAGPVANGVIDLWIRQEDIVATSPWFELPGFATTDANGNYSVTGPTTASQNVLKLQYVTSHGETAPPPITGVIAAVDIGLIDSASSLILLGTVLAGVGIAYFIGKGRRWPGGYS